VFPDIARCDTTAPAPVPSFSARKAGASEQIFGDLLALVDVPSCGNVETVPCAPPTASAAATTPPDSVAALPALLTESASKGPDVQVARITRTEDSPRDVLAETEPVSDEEREPDSIALTAVAMSSPPELPQPPEPQPVPAPATASGRSADLPAHLRRVDTNVTARTDLPLTPLSSPAPLEQDSTAAPKLLDLEPRPAASAVSAPAVTGVDGAAEAPPAPSELSLSIQAVAAAAVPVPSGSPRSGAHSNDDGPRSVEPRFERVNLSRVRPTPTISIPTISKPAMAEALGIEASRLPALLATVPLPATDAAGSDVAKDRLTVEDVATGDAVKMFDAVDGNRAPAASLASGLSGGVRDIRQVDQQPEPVSRPIHVARTDAGPSVVLHVDAPAQKTFFPAILNAVRQTLPPTVALPSPAATAHSIVQSLRMQAAHGGGTAVVTLTPEYLGSVTVSLRVTDGGVAARLHAENPSVRTWIEATVPLLRDGLAEQGLTLTEVVIGEHDDRRRQTDEPPRRHPDARIPVPRPRRREERTFDVVV
jgi:flagellar hook-length control protein FliK